MSNTLIDTETTNKRGRRFWLTIVAAVVLAGAVAFGLYWFFYARYFESTDDAYVAGNVVTITAKEAATVQALHADNTQTVRRGQLLVEMDPATAKVNLQAAEAELARAVRGVRGDFSRSDTAQAQLNQARVALTQARADYERRQKAAATGAVSAEELAHARDAVDAAQAAVGSASSSLAQSQASISGTDIATNPDVLAAEAKVRGALIAMSHMRVVAPVDGVIAQRTVQAGQHVGAGTPLMAVVPLNKVWIDANFKEVQLDRVRVGQPATVTADIYGSGVTYHGHVEGLGAGSGSAFALLPPQNASGNWIKIVQRVPVRIALDPKDIQAHPLRVGLSVAVDVDVSDQSGPLMTAKVGEGVTRADTGDDTDAQADAIIARILKDNSGAVR
ncbi:MAG: HlyD family efflux transporter periplasmic adaptor subunit [Alphaproteobacteria bacterium]|nr:HlyD family efflux transporter periplasmic adaptor subunit [Alphaproteobacteria bacterium]